MTSIAETLPKPTTTLVYGDTSSSVVIEKNKPEPKSDSLLKRIGKIFLKLFAALSIAVGTPVSIAGAIVLTKWTIASPALVPLFQIGFNIGVSALGLSAMLLSNPITALGAIFTLPAAGIAFTLPFSLPIIVGALPGAALASLGGWAWSKL